MPTIYESDIVLLESERLTDTDDGGGFATSRIVEDGQSGQVFPGISRVDAATGRLWLRKLFSGVQSENDDVARGMAAFISRRPANASIDIILFGASNFGDTQEEIRTAISGYLLRGSRTSMYLYEDHPAGIRSLTAVRNPEETPPSPGEVYILVDGDQEEAVRIEEVTEQKRSYEDGQGVFVKYLVFITITEPLRMSFSGVSELSRYGQGGGTLIYDTTVSDAARYYGSTTLVAQGSIDDTTITVDSVYNRIIPASSIESPIVD